MSPEKRHKKDAKNREKWLFSFHKTRPNFEGRIMRPACDYASLKIIDKPYFISQENPNFQAVALLFV